MPGFSYNDNGNHLNGNIICAIDVETTGLQFNLHDIIQICVMPVGLDLTYDKKRMHFHCYMKPRRPENIDIEADKVNRGRVTHALQHGIEPETAEERLREWFGKLGLPRMKKIIPLGHNYCYDRDFIQDWLGGPLSYAEFFRNDHRDTMQMALMINDMSAWHEEKIPFPKVGLKWLCNLLQVQHPDAHDAVGDCLSTIECYRRLMRWKSFGIDFPASPAVQT